MKYFTAEELKNTHQDEAHDILDECEGQIVKFDFGINLFKKWHEKIFRSDPNVKTLDLGTASGGFEEQLAEARYRNIYGVDIDDYLKPENKKLLKEFKTADLGYDKLPWPDNFFQIVAGWCILPHVENPFHAVREIHRVLDRGGVFMFSVPHLTSKPSIDYFSQHKDFGSYRASNNHLVLFPPAIIGKAILKYFDLLDVDYAVRPKIFERGWKGKLRKRLYDFADRFPKLKKFLGDRWSYDILYVVRKK